MDMKPDTGSTPPDAELPKEPTKINVVESTDAESATEMDNTTESEDTTSPDETQEKDYGAELGEPPTQPVDGMPLNAAPKQSSKKSLVIGLIAIVVLLGLAVAAFMMLNKKPTNTASQSSTSNTQASTATTSTNSAVTDAANALSSSATSEQTTVTTDDSGLATDASNAAGTVGGSVNETNF